VVLLGSVLAKAQELSSNGVAARSVTLLITDGDDQHSLRSKPRDVRALVRDLQRAESHVVAAMGIADGSTDFRRVFRDMGIEDRWILTPGNSPGEIRKAFQVFSQSAVRASQAATFNQAALGGFVH
jgi:class 3 adenylate cyclase